MRALRQGVRLRSAYVPASEAGFTLLEVIVATAVIGVAMAASTSFFVSTERATSLSAGQQTAVQLAMEGIEVVRAVPVTELRGAVGNSGGSWMPPSADAAASDDLGQPVRNDVRFARSWSVSQCWQPPAGGSCGNQAVGYLPFLRIVVTIAWADRRCAAACVFTTSTLVSNETREPVFAP
jgi:prepilin-type N-terminal cleavage/methylation domain-containing protein